MTDTLSRITVHGKFEDPNDPTAVMEGQKITFTPQFSGQLLNSSGDVIGVPRVVTKQLATDGSFSALLVATNSPNMQPQNWTYQVKAPFGIPPYSIPVDVASPGGSLDLINVVPAGTPSGGTVVLVPGRGITSMTINGSSHLIVTFTDGVTSDLGDVGGGGGGPGTPGRGIANTAISGGHLIVTYTDATTQDVGTVVGVATASSPLVLTGTALTAPGVITQTASDARYPQFAAVTGGWKFTGGSGKTLWVTNVDPAGSAANGDAWIAMP